MISPEARAKLSARLANARLVQKKKDALLTPEQLKAKYQDRSKRGAQTARERKEAARLGIEPQKHYKSISSNGHIYWTPEENRIVAARMFELIRAQGAMELPTQGMKRGKLCGPFVQIAQEGLPEQRRKSGKFFKYASSLRPDFWIELEALFKAVPLKVNGHPPAEPSPQPAPLPPPPPQVEPAETEAETSETRASRVVWTIEECTNLARETAKLMRKQNLAFVPMENDRTGSMMMLDCVRTAQLAVLPRERRHLAGMTRTRLGFRFWEPLKHFLKNPDQIERPKELARGDPETAPGAQETGKGEPEGYKDLADLLEGLSARLRPIMRDLSLIKQIEGYQELMTEELQGLRQNLNEANVRIAQLENKEAVQIAGVIPDNRPRVAIAAVRQDVFDEIVRKATEKGIDAKFTLYEQATKPRPLPNSDYAIVMRWGPHAWSEIASASIERGKWVYLPGGASQAVSQLEVWFSKES